MSDLSFVEKKCLENLFDMGGGYVLDFSDRTFQELIVDSVSKDIDDKRYNYQSCSKANRLRKFWKVEPNYIVGVLTRDMTRYAETLRSASKKLVCESDRIANRLLQSALVPELDAITPNSDERAFEALAKSVRNAIEENEPETGLDHLHTFVVKYVRNICDANDITTERSKPLHSMFGEYVKHLKAEGRLESKMSERILKSCISTLETFNHVRNDQSFAHDNELMEYHESLLIYNHVCALIRFLQWVENPDEFDEPDIETVDAIDDVPF